MAARDAPSDTTLERGGGEGSERGEGERGREEGEGEVRGG